MIGGEGLERKEGRGEREDLKGDRMGRHMEKRATGRMEEERESPLLSLLRMERPVFLSHFLHDSLKLHCYFSTVCFPLRTVFFDFFQIY